MKYEPNRYHRRSIRLKNYDYSQAGAYFVTICTQDRECLFGDIVDGEMRLNDAGIMVRDAWHKIPKHFLHADIDEFVVMPSHFHGIIVIVGAPLGGAHSSGIPIDNVETGAGTRPAPTLGLGCVVGEFKSITTHQYIDGVRQKDWPPFHGKLWQRNYYEHVVRNEKEMDRIRQYIIDNPTNWTEDEDNPANIIHRRGASCGCPFSQCGNT